MKHKKLLLVFSVLFVLSCSLTAISASDLNETNIIADDEAGDEIVSSDAYIENDITKETDSGNTFTDLKNKIDGAENVVLEHDYEYNESTDSGLVWGININRSNVVIDGDNHYINGALKSGIFNITNADNVTLKNINFVNASFRSNGGVLFIEGSSFVNIINCSFINNHANNDGGAVYVKTTEYMTITNSRFIGNNAGYGGAITAHENAQLIIIRTTFENNTAVYMGGAINVANANQIISGCRFINNNATLRLSGSGGAIYAENNLIHSISIANTEFIHNYAYEGGAINLFKILTIDFNNCSFYQNEAGICGAISYTRANVTIINTKFNKNHAGHSVGALRGESSSSWIRNCNFTDNYLTEEKNGAGAIYFDRSDLENVETIVNNCNFINNSGGRVAGAIYIANNATISNSNFTSNNADWGAAIFSIGEATINNSNFIDNDAESGGAIFNFNGLMSIDNSRFMENDATRDGGALLIYGARNYISNTEFSGNTAGDGNDHIALADKDSKANLNNVTPSNLVPKFPVTMEVNAKSEFNYTENINITAFNIAKFGELLNNGEVIFSFMGDNISVNVTNGVSTLNLGGVDAGSYMVDMIYIGDAENGNPKRTVEFKVLKIPAVLEVLNVTNCTYGDSIQINATVTGRGITVSGGRVLVIINGKEYFDYVRRGFATINIPKIDVGNYSVNVTYDGNYYTNDVPIKFEVSKCPATIEIADIANCTYGNSIIIKVNVTGGSSAINEGNVSTVVNGNVYSASVINGTATIEIPNLSIGTYEANLTFGGNYLADNVSVKFEVSIGNAVINAKNIAYVINYGGKYSAVIKDVNGKAVVGEKVTFTFNGKNIGSAVTDKNGVASIKLTPATLKAAKVGKKNLVIKLASGNYNPVSKTVKVTINKEKTKILKAKKTYKFKKSKKAKNIKVTLKDSKNKVIKKAKVTIKLSGKKIKGKKTITAKTNKKGVVTFKLGKKLTKKTKVKYTITFKGNAYYNKVVKKGKIKVK